MPSSLAWHNLDAPAGEILSPAQEGWEECRIQNLKLGAEAHIQGGRVFRADQKMDVKVRYSPRVARWIVEKEALEMASDGSVTVTYEVVDPHWIVRHVLQYGPEAVVLESEEVRGWVRGVVKSIPSTTEVVQ